MPIYEYIAIDGARLELLRPMADADKPVTDPDGLGRAFKRTHSTFASPGGEAGRGATSTHTHTGGSCPCGKRPGSCGGG
ncbi:hypothetical protein BH11PLA1_BH11PLA1_17160 [soil metagenome]